MNKNRTYALASAVIGTVLLLLSAYFIAERMTAETLLCSFLSILFSDLATAYLRRS
jgi:hypothetical protein